MNHIGEQIRSLRLRKGVTQEALAEKLHVTGQAVSKWENGASAPDIALLPELSVYFGVTIDELFALTDDMRLDRVDSMLEDKRDLTQAEARDAEAFLKDCMAKEDKKARCLRLLADLNNHQADTHFRLAAEYAMQGLEKEPTWKDLHSALTHAQHGAYQDWVVDNHRERIEYYRTFTEKNPDYGPGYMYLCDDLIADGRLEEAKQAAEQVNRLMPGFRYWYYQGLIAWKEKGEDAALAAWEKLREDGDWLASLCLGDCYARLGCYDEAAECFRQATKLQPKPRYTDGPFSIAMVREIQGRYEEAAQAMDDAVAILREEWNVTSGEMLDEPMRMKQKYLEKAKA